MSFEFSRRNFLKYTAVAAVAVAGAGLFTGCSIDTSDSYNPLSNGAGKLTLLQVTAEMGTYVEKDKKYTDPSFSDGKKSITFPMKITNGRANPIYINPNNFSATVYSKDAKVVAKYNYYNNGLSFDGSLFNTNLVKDGSVSGSIKLAMSSALADGQYVVLTYCPDLQYNEYSMNWRLPKVTSTKS